MSRRYSRATVGCGAEHSAWVIMQFADGSGVGAVLVNRQSRTSRATKSWHTCSNSDITDCYADCSGGAVFRVSRRRYVRTGPPEQSSSAVCSCHSPCNQHQRDETPGKLRAGAPFAAGNEGRAGERSDAGGGRSARCRGQYPVHLGAPRLSQGACLVIEPALNALRPAAVWAAPRTTGSASRAV